MPQSKGAASGMHATLLDLGAHAMKFLNATRLQRVRALEQLGFQRRRNALGPVLFFVAGALVAGSVALVLAPSGKKLRAKIVGLVGLARDNDPASKGSKDPATGLGMRWSVAGTSPSMAIIQRRRGTSRSPVVKEHELI